MKNILIFELLPNEIIGTNEFYNYKSYFHYFNVSVTTGQAVLIFIPKIIFHEIIAHEIKIKNSLITKVEFKVKLFSGKLQKYKKNLMISIQNKILERQNNKHKLFSPTHRINRNYRRNLFLSPLNSIIKNSIPDKKVFFKSNNNTSENSKNTDLTESRYFKSNR